MKPFNINVKFVKCHSDAILPDQNDGDVGFNLYSTENCVISPRKRFAIPTGLMLADSIERLFVYDHTTIEAGKIVAAAVPFFKIEGRSGLALNHGLFPIGGILDPSYRGEIKIIMFNSDDSEFIVKKGMKIAQMVCYLTFSNNFPITVTAQETNEIVSSARNSNGFGSSGNFKNG